ncbi:hypothetical protein N7490_006410 [Penicillium lividum]|nr:hypothetical protein N7490_006410 [Penicillium lividum]
MKVAARACIAAPGRACLIYASGSWDMKIEPTVTAVAKVTAVLFVMMTAPAPTATSGEPETNMPTTRGELQGLLVQAMKDRFEFLRVVDNVLGQSDAEIESIVHAIDDLI